MNIKNLKAFILSIGLFGILFSLKVQAMDKGHATEDDIMESEIYNSAAMMESDIDGELVKRFNNLNLNTENVEFSVEEAIEHILNYKDESGVLSEIKKSDIRGLEEFIRKSGEYLKRGEEKEIKYEFFNEIIKPCELYLRLKLNNDGEILVTKIEIGLSEKCISDGKCLTFDGFEIMEGREDFMDFD